MKKSFLLFASMGMFAYSYAQESQKVCGQELMIQQAVKNDPSFMTRLYKAEADAAMLPLAGQKTTAQSAVPVVFHLLLTQYQFNSMGGEAGIKARINSQLAVLNKDYQRLNPDNANVPADFMPLVGNPGIEFKLATVDANGNATPGFDYKIITNGANFDANGACKDAKYASSGGIDIWNPDRYYNIWVCTIAPITGGSVLGVATPPAGSLITFAQAEQGTVLDYRAFGEKGATQVVGPFYPAAGRGRTLTHESGHFFNLYHTFGVYGACSTDFVGDTPNQEAATNGCPAFPLVDACTTTSPGVMFMNFMDYSNDDCMNMFSQGQVTRMQQTFAANGPRAELFSHPELTTPMAPTGVKETAALDHSLNISPNPGNGFFVLQVKGGYNLKNVMVVDGMGKEIFRANGNDLSAMNNMIDISRQPNGMYFVKCIFDEGTVTEKVIVNK